MKKIFIILFSVISALSFAENENLVRKISVTGNAEREILPDMATLTFVIETKKQNLTEATNDSNKRFEKFKNTLKSKNIKVENFETISFSNYKNKEFISYDEDTTKEKTPTSYTVKLGILMNNIDFNKISDLMEEGSDNFKSIQKNFKDNSFLLEISENGKTVDSALNKVFEKLNTTKAKLKRLGIPENNILVGSYDVKETYDKITNNQEEFYHVIHSFKLDTKNLKDLNTIISLADDNEINIEGNINFNLTNKEQIQSEMYNEAYNQAKQKASSILKSSNMKLGTPIIVSEDIEFQQKMIDSIDSEWRVEPVAYAVAAEPQIASRAISMKERSRSTIDYTPKPLKLQQNISVMYEIK